MLQIVNQSFREGKFPEILKTSHVTPIAKKGQVDYNNLGSYRPINDLSFMSKVIEKCALVQLLEHLTSNNLLINKQSAYRKDHSCETALIDITNDVLSNFSKETSVLMALLDFSSAFDTISHQRLIEKLEYEYGVTGKALEWFKSYLTNIFFQVKIENNLSKKNFYSVVSHKDQYWAQFCSHFTFRKSCK